LLAQRNNYCVSTSSFSKQTYKSLKMNSMKKTKSKLELLIEDYVASSKENDRVLTEKFAETDRQMKETEI
jgi:hypothetical protein